MSAAAKGKLFDELYRGAQGDERQAYWASRSASWWLTSGTVTFPPSAGAALVCGCGLGSDAEFLAERGFAVTAFDISPTAMRWCRDRFPRSAVEYGVADLVDPPPDWMGRFDLVFEAHTLEVLPIDSVGRALKNLGEFVRPGGSLVLVFRAFPANGADIREALRAWVRAADEWDAGPIARSKHPERGGPSFCVTVRRNALA